MPGQVLTILIDWLCVCIIHGTAGTRLALGGPIIIIVLINGIQAAGA